MSDHRNIVGMLVTPCLVAMTKCLTKEIILAPSSRVQSTLVGKAWWQDGEAVPYMTFSVREAQSSKKPELDPSFLFIRFKTPVHRFTFGVGLPTSQTCPKFCSRVTLNPEYHAA